MKENSLKLELQIIIRFIKYTNFQKYFSFGSLEFFFPLEFKNHSSYYKLPKVKHDHSEAYDHGQTHHYKILRKLDEI